MARRQGSRLGRLERLEAKRPTEPTSHVCIYDAGSGETLNGEIPETAECVLYIPHNHRETINVKHE